MDIIGGPMRIASMFAAIGVDLSPLNAGLRDAKTQLTGFERTMQGVGRVGDQLTGLGKKLALGITTPLVGLGVAAVREFGAFEAQTNILNIAARSSGTSLDDLREAALAVGGDISLVGIDAMQAADAMTTLYKAGMDTGQVFGDLQGYLGGTAQLGGVLRAAIDLAAASNIELAESSDLVSVAMATWGLKTEQATSISDVFVAAADASIAEVSDLRDAMENVGPVAASMGIDVGQLATLLALLSEKGISGAEAGSALKSMLLNMRRPTDDVKEAWAELGVALYDADGNMRAIPAVLQDLQGALYGQVTATQVVGGATKEQQAQLKEWEAKIKSARVHLEEYQAGIKGTGQSEEARNRRMKELTDTIEFYSAKVSGLNIAQTETLTSTRMLTQAERDAYMDRIAGGYGIKALTGLVTEEGFAYDEMVGKMGESATAAEVAQKRTEGLSGAMEALSGAWQTLRIRMGEPIAAVVTPIVEGAAEVTAELGELSPESLKTLVTLGGAAAVAGPALFGLGTILKMAPTFVSPLGLLTLGVAAFGVTAFLASDQGEELRDSMHELGRELQQKEGLEGLGLWVEKLTNLADAAARVGDALEPVHPGATAEDYELALRERYPGLAGILDPISEMLGMPITLPEGVEAEPRMESIWEWMARIQADLGMAPTLSDRVAEELRRRAEAEAEIPLGFYPQPPPLGYFPEPPEGYEFPVPEMDLSAYEGLKRKLELGLVDIELPVTPSISDAAMAELKRRTEATWRGEPVTTPWDTMAIEAGASGERAGAAFDSGIVAGIQRDVAGILDVARDIFSDEAFRPKLAPMADTDTARRQGWLAADAWLAGVRARFDVARAARAADQMWEDQIANETRAMGWE